MSTTALPVPAILNILNCSNSNYMDQNVESLGRAKKRRLDHLSWEEKIQRKKLKNRVAAQTSRDRKKAKLDQMESAIQQLFSKNENLLEECERLMEANERLQTENAELNQRLQQTTQSCACQNRSVVCASESGSAESLLRPKGTEAHAAAILTNQQRALVKIVLVCLLYPICWTNSTRKRSISTPSNSLRRLCSKISPEIWRALLKRQLIKYENQKLCNTHFEESTSNEVVGSSSKQLEPSRTKMLKTIKSDDSVEQNISEYLLLHHNYAKKAPAETKKLKPIRPKTELAVCTPVQITLNENPITLVQVETENTLSVPETQGSLSPRSDLGYESVGSPVSSEIDNWDSCVSELFPSLF